MKNTFIFIGFMVAILLGIECKKKNTISQKYEFHREQAIFIDNMREIKCRIQSDSDSYNRYNRKHKV